MENIFMSHPPYLCKMVYINDKGVDLIVQVC
jgi:hypothetical protein